ncbi:c-type cytochrome biogenesis protein CcsB [Solihabitans fulvus]|uniref:C-type cytochrome biogenesis protein CcsB n=1 Tax=Solihabitans fulvus TaxID=1892852 RepID=A0A5B2XLT6_9PSEU|nr:c-type cytochrome biogenesis protein CcsB [Solihabitans fulvus]KAA2264828.1 c-type cytochrome biogenesis protein CcsB [Solihabitans fulvus]
MPVNTNLATFSDWAYTSAAAVYILAMIFYLVEQAFGRVTKRAQARELVTAGGGDTVLDEPQAPSGPVERDRPERFGRMAVALTVLGVLLHVGSLVLRGLAAGRVPWGNMYEYGALFCLVAVVTWLVMLRKFPVRRLGAFVLVPVVILMLIGGMGLYTDAAPVQPALQSYWLVIHVSVISAASGMLLVPGVVSLLFMVRAANEANPGRFARLAPRLPAADVLDRLAYRTTVFAFPLYTFGLICGAIWAESAWGRFWGWDPKETTAFVAWVIYAAYLHARATAGWRGTRAAVVNVLGFATMVFNLFFVNLVTTGLHSYAGVG